MLSSTELFRSDGAVLRDILPASVAGANIGSASLPFDTIYVGTVVADNIVGAITTLDNAEWLRWRNFADNANINVMRVDASDNTIINANAGDFIRLQIGEDAQRVLTYSANTDVLMQLTYGDATAAQRLAISSLSIDGADNSSTEFYGGGLPAAGWELRGGAIVLRGNEWASTGGAVFVSAGNIASGSIYNYIYHASATIRFNFGNNTMWSISATGALQSDINNGGVISMNRPGVGINFFGSGATIGVDSGTPATAARGTATLNGTTPVVVATTAASTGMMVLLARSSGGTAGNIFYGTIVNGVSFAITSTNAADTGTVDWWIIKDA